MRWLTSRNDQHLPSGGCFSFFPTCQVRVVRFYVSCLLLPPASSSSSSPPRPPRPPCHPCRPCRPRRPRRPCSTATRDPQCSLPDLNHDHPRPVFPAGPQPRPSTPSVPCRTSTASIHAKCSLPDLMPDRMPEDLPDRMPENMPENMPDRYAR